LPTNTWEFLVYDCFFFFHYLWLPMPSGSNSLIFNAVPVYWTHTMCQKMLWWTELSPIVRGA
jgi:hypothetical protein